MSVIEEDLLAPRITKKSVIKVIVVASLLITLFAFSTFIYASILGTQRRDPSEKLEDADREDATLVSIPPPWDIEDLIDDLDINLTELAEELDLTEEELEELLGDTIEEMYDGNIDDLDLSDYQILIAALVFLGASEQEVFRVYDYDNPVLDREDILWKYECFDEFTGDGWESNALKTLNNFYDYDDYYSTYSYLDLIRIKRPLSPNLGTNSLVLASFFPEPYIIEESIDAPNLEEDETLLYKDELGCTTADLRFTSDNDVNLTCDLFGDNLPTNDDINNTAVNAQFTPSAIQSRYLQLPPTISTYLANNNDFKFHYDILDLLIDQDVDSAFVVANIIRNYLQSNFDVDYYELLNDPPDEGEDQVEWFCEKEEGLWSEFASAFCAFTRAFGVASRFVDGFNSRNITQFFDTEEGKNTYAIKYKNIYNWAEIYVPTGPGVGRWVQMDILYDSYGIGGNPLIYYNITVESDFETYNRFSQANITATLSSATASISGKEISFYDETDPTISLPSATTDYNGKASILIPIDIAQVVGPHTIEARYAAVSNTTQYAVLAPIEVNLHSLDPPTVNLSESVHTTNIVGNVSDPVNGKGVRDSIITFLLFEKGTDTFIPAPFNPPGAITNDNGEFDLNLDVDQDIPIGEYYVRVDFNGTWYNYPFVLNNINDSSNTLDLNITKEVTYELRFSINEHPTKFPDFPNPSTLININRGQILNISTVVYDPAISSFVPGQVVDFYDYTNGDLFIGSAITDSKGNASILYTTGMTNKTGPTLVYAQVGNVRNYSYYVLNEPIHVNLISGPTPLTINIQTGGSDPFNIQGTITDEVGNPIGYAEVRLKLFRSGFDYSGYLNPQQSYPFVTGPDGSFNLDFEVDETTPIGNYSLRFDFNGTFDFTYDLNNDYPFTFDLPSFSNSSQFQNELEVIDLNAIEIYLAVDGDPTRVLYDELNPPGRYKLGENATFQVTIIQSGGNPLSGTRVRIIDVYDANVVLDERQYDGSFNFVEFNISIAQFTFAGIHKINIRFYDQFDQPYPTINSTFIIINETVSFYPDPLVSPNIIQRNDGSLTISGYVEENGRPMRGLLVRLLLYDKNYNNVSQYLIGGNIYALTSASGYYLFNINYINITCPQGLYYIRVDFNGTIQLSEVPGIDLIPNYMVSSSSNYIGLNVTAGTNMAQIDYYTNTEQMYPSIPLLSKIWVENDVLHVIGELYWDNLTLMAGMKVNITIQYALNGTIIAYNDTVITDASGEFHGLLLINENWPNLRIATQIIVYFEPEDNNLEYVESSNISFV